MVDTQNGTILGSYRIIRPLGKGGEGSVYLSIHLRTGQYWALKVIKGQWAKGRHEMEMLKRLSHPSLPRIIDIFRTAGPDGQEYAVLVTEYICGMTLENCVCRDRRLTRKQTWDAAWQLAGVLAYLHGRKEPVCHLDLKPSNLILTPEGRLCLTDFGSAVLPDHEDPAVRSGTDGYAAPEQYDPEGVLDERTDLYGFGAVLYRLISGKKYSPILYHSRIPACPAPMERIIKKCLEREPDRRYQSAQELLKDLRRINRSTKAQKRRIRLWSAAWIGILAVYAAASGVLRQIGDTASRNREYQSLMQEILNAPEEKLMPLYQEAVFMAPERKEAWISFISWKDRDGLLSQEEDVQLRTLLHSMPLGTGMTYEEMLQKHNTAYGEVCCALGILYWYDYSGEGARRIAQGWFRKACTAAGNTSEDMSWVKTARLYVHVGSYIDSFDVSGGSRNGEESAFEYWKDTGELLATEETETFDERKRLLLYESCINRMIMDAGKLYNMGVSAEQLRARLDVLEQKILRLEEQKSGEKDMAKQAIKEAREVLNSLKK